MNIVGIAGSPTSPSRSSSLLRAALMRLAPVCVEHSEIEVRNLPADALLGAHTWNPALISALAQVSRADLVLVATPIYKAAYSGALKAFLDLLPQDGLSGKMVLPLATGGSQGHLLALDYALKPVLSALGARHILDAVFAEDGQFVRTEGEGYAVSGPVMARLERALQPVLPAASASAALNGRGGATRTAVTGLIPGALPGPGRPIYGLC